MKYLTMLLDGSGSMAQRKEKTIDAVNEYIAGFKGQKDILFKLVVWDTGRFEVLWNGDINQCVRLTNKNYVLASTTPLYDSIGRGLNDLSQYTDDESKKMLVVMTDGKENASQKFTKARIRDMIESFRNDYGNEVIFLGADINIDQEGEELGVSKINTISYSSDESETVYRRSADMTKGFFGIDGDPE